MIGDCCRNSLTLTYARVNESDFKSNTCALLLKELLGIRLDQSNRANEVSDIKIILKTSINAREKAVDTGQISLFRWENREKQDKLPYQPLETGEKYNICW